MQGEYIDPNLTPDYLSDFGLGKDFLKRTHEPNLYKRKKKLIN